MTVPTGWQVSKGEAGAVIPGTPDSAPVDARPRRKVLITTLVSGLVVLVRYVVIEGHFLTLDDISWIATPTYD